MDFSILDYIWLIPALPLLAVIINGFFGWKLGRASGWVASVLVLLTFVVSLLTLFTVYGRPAHEGAFQYNLYTWIPSGDFKVDVAFLIDPLTAIMLCVVTSVGALVHFYSME